MPKKTTVKNEQKLKIYLEKQTAKKVSADKVIDTKKVK